MNVYVDSAFVSWSALNARGDRTMSHIIPLLNVQKVDVHYKDPNKNKPKTQREGIQIHDLFMCEAEQLK